jgi:hypothetical protein
MPFATTFTEFYNKVKTSLTDGTFAKLTLAKTIGNTDLMNIYVRPILNDTVLKMELKFKYQQEEIIEIYSIDQTCQILIPYINSPFLSALLFTTEFDLVYKLNKKRAVTVTETSPTFAHASPVIIEYLRGAT